MSWLTTDSKIELLKFLQSSTMGTVAIIAAILLVVGLLVWIARAVKEGAKSFFKSLPYLIIAAGVVVVANPAMDLESKSFAEVVKAIVNHVPETISKLSHSPAVIIVVLIVLLVWRVSKDSEEGKSNSWINTKRKES